MSSVSDATHAYRGYRLQALYVLWRILAADASQDLVFQPEGKEDLAIFDLQGDLVEVVQVKAHEANLTVSDFSPDKPESFFPRAVGYLNTDGAVRIRVVSYGNIGPELLRACGTDRRTRETVARKISAHKLISQYEAESVLDRIELETVREDVLTVQVFNVLRNSLAGVDPQAAFEMLWHGLFICSENKCKITRHDIIERLNAVGRFTSARASYHEQWFTTIVPIEDPVLDPETSEELTQEFYRGVSARYVHIAAGVDVIRESKLREIAAKFAECRIVIIHGASGQGKSTLAYRYLHESFPGQWRFQVRVVENRQHALRVAQALASHADAIGIPLAVYVDVSPSDRDWPELVRQLATHRNIRTLVTIREEDFQRASIMGAAVPFADVSLEFDYKEARNIYDALTERRPSQDFLNFEDAWNRFGAGGPLLEFVYLVTQGGLLRERLTAQVHRLQDEVICGERRPNELELLRLVSVASSYGARLRVRPLVHYLQLAVATRTLQMFENEYLLKRSADDALVQGLHPIRSAILCELLTDPTFAPWVESARACLPFIVETDVEVFLLHAFSRRETDTGALLDAITEYQPSHWSAVAGVIRALNWLGIREYVKTNSGLIEDVMNTFGRAWNLMLDPDIADAMPGLAASLWEQVGDIADPETARRAQLCRERQTDRGAVFSLTRAWLSTRTTKPEAPISHADWWSLAESVFWLGRLQVNWPLAQCLPLAELDQIHSKLPLAVLADVILGLATGHSDGLAQWLQAHRDELISRFRLETNTVLLNDDGEVVEAHFIYPFDEVAGPKDGSHGEAQSTRDLHDEAVFRMWLLRRLLPDRDVYGGQGYGYRLWSESPEYDPSKKRLERRSLPLPQLTAINATLRGIVEKSVRPATWQEYADAVLTLRHAVIDSLKQLERGLDSYFRKQGQTNILKTFVNADGWNRLQKELANPPLLPSVAVDEWGFVDESASSWAANPHDKRTLPIKGLAIQVYKPFGDPFRQYTTGLSNFFTQSIHPLTLNPALGRGIGTDAQRAAVLEKAQELRIRTDFARLSIRNLTDAIKALAPMQREYRRLLNRYVGESALGALEFQERRVMSAVWSMWYFFANHPARVMQNASKECPKKVDDVLRTTRQVLKAKLRELTSDTFNVRILSEDVAWKAEPAIWIAMDGDNPLEVYSARDRVFGAVRHAFTAGEGTDLRQYVLELNWPNILLVPMIRGKCLTKKAWRFSVLDLLFHNEVRFASNFQLSIDDDALAKLRLSTWAVPGLSVGEDLMTSTSELSLLAGHIRDCKRLPDLDEFGAEQLGSYLQGLSKPLSAALQSALDAASVVLHRFNQLSTPEQQGRAALMSAVEAVIELRSYLLPSEGFEQSEMMNIEQISEWANRLEQARTYAVLAYLYWVADVLDEVEVSRAAQLWSARGPTGVT